MLCRALFLGKADRTHKATRPSQIRSLIEPMNAKDKAAASGTERSNELTH